MSVFRWVELDRQSLARTVPNALVVIPLGAVEQHGDHLPTGTDYLLASALVTAAAEHAAASTATDIVVTPALSIGASDHHLPFGGTLSLLPQTLLAMLTGILASAASAGARRVILVNGHGGNSGICHAAAAAASARNGLTVVHIDYWRTLPEGTGIAGAPVPGHAGAFETALVLATYPDLVRDRTERAEPASFAMPRGVELHSAQQWAAIDGFTDHPERATVEAGRALMEKLVNSLSAALVELAEAP